MKPVAARGVVLVMFVALAYLTFLLVVPVRVLEVMPNERGNAYTVLTHDVARGQDLLVSARFCKYDDVHAQARAWLELEGALIEVSPVWPPLQVGCHDVSFAFAKVPATLSVESTSLLGTGKARLRVDATYTVNGKSKTYRLYSDYFRITE